MNTEPLKQAIEFIRAEATAFRESCTIPERGFGTAEEANEYMGMLDLADELQKMQDRLEKGYLFEIGEPPAHIGVDFGVRDELKVTIIDPTPMDREPANISLADLQTNLPWTIRYSRDFRASPMAHKDFAHALHHASKAAGKLHGLADDMDHDRAVADDPALAEEYGKYVADLVICALRAANTFPGRTLDLQRLVVERLEDKNGVTLTGKEA